MSDEATVKCNRLIRRGPEDGTEEKGHAEQIGEPLGTSPYKAVGRGFHRIIHKSVGWAESFG